MPATGSIKRWQHIIQRHAELADQADNSELTEDDIVIRYDQAEAIIGLTILNASQR